MEYSFNIQEAKQYGINEAIFLKNLKTWIMVNRANETNFHQVSEKDYPNLKGQSRYWSYNSFKAYAKLFPFWNERQVRHTIDSLLKKNVILKGVYNSNPYDRTSWYALFDESIIDGMQMTNMSNEDLPNMSNQPIDKNVKSKTYKNNTDENSNETIELPIGLDTPEFTSAWSALLKTKKWKKKEPNTLQLCLKKLAVYEVAFAVSLIDTAIMGEYQGVVFGNTPQEYEKWKKAKASTPQNQTFQQPHPNFPNRPLYVNSFADKWAKVKWWRTNLAELENGQDKEYSFTEISKMLQYTEPLNILK